MTRFAAVRGRPSLRAWVIPARTRSRKISRSWSKGGHSALLVALPGERRAGKALCPQSCFWLFVRRWHRPLAFPRRSRSRRYDIAPGPSLWRFERRAETERRRERQADSFGFAGVCRRGHCALRSDDTEAPSGVASGPLAVGSALMLPRLFADERLSPSARVRLRSHASNASGKSGAAAISRALASCTPAS
jgi:hypothetical protein